MMLLGRRAYMDNTVFNIIHTSDWHLGQHFMGRSRQAEHQKFLAWLIETAITQHVDAIIVAGDIFDTGSPPSYARELYNQFIVNLQATGIHLIILGGNHDSTATLGESKGLLACLNTHVIPGALVCAHEQVIQLNNPANDPQALICAIPFLRSRDILHSTAGQSGSQKQQNLQQAITDHYHAIYAIAEKQQAIIQKKYSKKIPIIATGHLTTVGAKSSESVRDIYIGSLEAFPSSAFPPANYIALGHIHRPQLVGGAEHIRYCGSPIALSFDELTHEKNIVKVEFKAGEFITAVPVEVPRFQPMHQLRGNLEEIKKQLDMLAKKYTVEQPAWLDIEVSQQDFLNDLQLRIQHMVDNLPLDVLKVRKARVTQTHSLAAATKETLHELTPTDVFERRLALEDWNGEEQQAKKHRVSEAFQQVIYDISEED